MSVFVSFSIGSKKNRMSFTCKSYKWLDVVSHLPIMEAMFSDFKYPKGVTILQPRGLVVKASRNYLRQ